MLAPGRFVRWRDHFPALTFFPLPARNAAAAAAQLPSVVSISVHDLTVFTPHFFACRADAIRP